LEQPFHTGNRKSGRIKNSCNRLAAARAARTAGDLEVCYRIFDGQVGLVNEEVSENCDQMRTDDCWRSLTIGFQSATTESAADHVRKSRLTTHEQR
jgi:hypothetical protein